MKCHLVGRSWWFFRSQQGVHPERPAGSPVRAAGAAPPTSKKPHLGASSGFTSSEDISLKEMGDDDDDDDEISFNIKGGPSGTGKDLKADNPGKQLRQPIAKKNLKKVQALNSLLRAKRGSDSKGRALTSWWNRTGHRKKPNETKRGWMKKSVWAHDANGKILRRAHPSTVALREIHFYQHTQVFLIATSAFQCVVREIAVDFKADFRWQATALYYLQVAAEAYLVGFLCDTNLCVLHHKCCMIFPKDLHLARRLRGHSETGVGVNMSDKAQ